MEFRQVLYYDAVYRNKSISKAAQELFVTQQCVSKQIITTSGMSTLFLWLKSIVKRRIHCPNARWLYPNAGVYSQTQESPCV